MEKYSQTQHLEEQPQAGNLAAIDRDPILEVKDNILHIEALKTVTPDWEFYQLASDNRTVLIPQPSQDVNDPLNWTRFRKHAVLLVVAATAFLPDYGSAVGAVTLIPQSAEWGLSPDTVNHSQVGNVFMLGAGGLFVVALSAYFGRLPVLFWFTWTALWTAAGCAGATTFNAFMAFRILNGFFSTVAQGGGVMFIRDMFFLHERARKINLWASFVILSPYFGPLITAFVITTESWRWAFGLYTIMTGLCLIAQIAFGEETFYDRDLPQADRSVPRPGTSGRMLRIIGIEQWRCRKQRKSFAQAVSRPFRVLVKPTIFLSTIYYLLTFAWVVGINTTLSIFITAPPYNFGTKSIGFFYFTPVIAAILGEVLGRWLHDWIANVLMKRNGKGELKPEYRLMAITLSTPCMIAGLLVLGFALEGGWHYMLAAFGWGLYVFGIMITTVAITAYCLDCYPEGSGEVCAWLNFARTTGGFIISYFQVTWANAQGTRRSFGVQAAICFAAYLIILVMQVYGGRMRAWAGPLKFKTS